MNKKQAVKRAIKALEEVNKKYHFDANLHTLLKLDLPHSTRCFNERRKNLESIEILDGIANEKI